MQSFTIEESESGQRLDRYLKKILPSAPLSFIYKMERLKKIRINSKRAGIDTRLEGGDSISLYLNDEEFELYRAERKSSSPIHSNTKFDSTWILYEDEYLLIINKPPRLTVHPGDHKTTEASLIELAQDYLGKQYNTPSFKPSLAHRLDRDTSGAIIIAKSRPALNTLLESLQTGKFKKTYTAIVYGRPEKSRGTISAPLLRIEGAQNEAKVQVRQDGQRAITHYQVKKNIGKFSLLEIQLETGRTHQIRVHLAHLECPILGDKLYGNRQMNTFMKRELGISRQLLHATRLSFPHPITQNYLTVEASLPDDFNSVLSLSKDFQ